MNCICINYKLINVDSSLFKLQKLISEEQRVISLFLLFFDLQQWQTAAGFTLKAALSLWNLMHMTWIFSQFFMVIYDFLTCLRLCLQGHSLTILCVFAHERQLSALLAHCLKWLSVCIHMSDACVHRQLLHRQRGKTELSSLCVLLCLIVCSATVTLAKGCQKKNGCCVNYV